MSDCDRKGRWIGGCYFVAAYDITPPNSLPALETTPNGARMFIDALSTKVFKGTFCTRCGRKGEA